MGILSQKLYNREAIKSYMGCDSGISCLLGSKSCHLCCQCLPTIKESTGTKIMYTIFLIIVTAAASALNFEPFKEWLHEFEEFENFCENLKEIDKKTDFYCDELFGYSAVYMIFLGNTVFFFTMG